MQNKKVILFLELNFLTIIPCVICKVFNYSTFYLASSKYFRNESIFRILEFVNISKLNYEYFDNEVEYKLIKNLCGNAHDLYFKYYKDNVFEKLINEYFNFNSDNKKIFELAIDDYLIKKLNGKYGLGTGIVGLYIFAEYFSKKNSNVYVFVSRNIYTKDIINKYKKYINMYPWWLNTILNTIKSIYNLLYFAIYKLLYFVKYLYEKIFINKFVKTEKKIINNYDIKNSNQDIIFFPHHGIYYGDLFIKDQFYNDCEESPFHKTKILHLSLGESESELKKTKEYYNKESIPHMDFYDLQGENILKTGINILKMVWSNKYRIIKSIHTTNSIVIRDFIYFFRIISYHKCLINKLEGVKLALIGYEFIFPPFLSLALSNCHIKTAAVQERLLAPLWMWHKIVLDYYFIFGASTEEVIKKGLEWCHVKNTHKVGVLKTDIVKNEETKGVNRKYKRIKDECFILLALDYLSSNYKIDNVERAVSNWKNLKIFYIDMIKLASNIPGLFIIIKGKDASIITHPEFQDIFNIINAMPNIKVVDDVITDSPSKMIALADAAVALYTSMGDELLAVGKPVIFYDYFGIPSPYFNYENYPVIVKTYHELEKRIRKLVRNNDFMDAQQFNEMRCRLYEGNANGKVKSILNKRLENIYSEVSV